MAFPGIPADQSTGDIAPVSWADDVVELLTFLSNPPACRVYHNTTQSLANGASVTVVFNSERYDTDGMHSTATNTSRITINTAGLYVVGFYGLLSSDSDYTAVRARLVVSGVTDIANMTTDHDTTLSLGVTLTAVWKFTAGQYVETVVTQTNASAGAATLIGDHTDMWATWIGLGT